MSGSKFNTAGPDPMRVAMNKLPSTEDDALRNRHPAIFAPTPKKDQRQGRTVPMGVLNLGMPRTGTMSMQRALNILGYNCYHSSIFFSRIEDCKVWDAALNAKFFGKGKPFTRADFDTVLGEFSSVSADPPAVAFAEDLVAAYPEAKVILVERDIEAWFRSFSSNVTDAMWSPLMNRLADWDPSWLGAIRDTHMLWTRGWFQAHSKEEEDAVSRQMYKDHYAVVRRVTPKERLLEYKLGDGWEPLCEFLGKDTPDCEFPHVNDSDAIWELLAIASRRGLRNAIWRLVRMVGIGLVVSVLAWWIWASTSISPRVLFRYLEHHFASLPMILPMFN